jgi:hypothetical protein
MAAKRLSGYLLKSGALNETKVTKVFEKDKEVVNVVIDPLKETADINIGDNMFPRVVQPSKFDELKKKTN